MGSGSVCVLPSVWTGISQLFSVCADSVASFLSFFLFFSPPLLVQNSLRLSLTFDKQLASPRPSAASRAILSFSARHSGPLTGNLWGIASWSYIMDEWMNAVAGCESQVPGQWCAALDQLQSPLCLSGSTWNQLQSYKLELNLRGWDGLNTRPPLNRPVSGCRLGGGWSRWRPGASFHPPRLTATAPSQSLINSRHIDHGRYQLISHVCVILSLHMGVNTYFRW